LCFWVEDIDLRELWMPKSCHDLVVKGIILISERSVANTVRGKVQLLDAFWQETM